MPPSGQGALGLETRGRIASSHFDIYGIAFFGAWVARRSAPHVVDLFNFSATTETHLFTNST